MACRRLVVAAFVCAVLLNIIGVTKGSREERRLLKTLFAEYSPLERPVVNHSEPVVVQFGLTLQQIIDVDEKFQVFQSNIWLNYEWLDVNLRWNLSDFGNISSIRVPAKWIWKPDILMYNSADENFDATFHTNVIITNDGKAQWIPPGMFKSTCKIDITWYPFDDQECKMKFGSWTHDGKQIDLQLASPEGDTSTFILNGEWTLLGLPGKRNVKYYDCCPDNPYHDITFIVKIRRRTVFFVTNLILPCAVLSSMSLVSYLIPPDAGEKVAFEVPAIRSEIFYECCPGTPYIDVTYIVRIRRRILYFFVNLILPTLLISAIALITFTLPPDSGEKVSLCVTILLSLTVFLLLVAENMPPTSDAVSLIGTYFSCVLLMCSLSVVMTVLVLNFHHRNPSTHTMPRWVKTVICEWLAWILRMQRPGHELSKLAKRKDKESREDDEFDEQTYRPLTSASRLNNNVGYAATNRPRPMYANLNSFSEVTHQVISPELAQERSTIETLLSELRYLTDRLRCEDEVEKVKDDWKFAAMVIDRCCLCIFIVFTVATSAAVLLSAPHVFGH